MRVRTVFNYGSGSPGLMTNYFDAPVDDPAESHAQSAVTRVKNAMNTSPNLWPTTFTWEVQGQVDVLLDSTGEAVGAFSVPPETGAGGSPSPLGALPVGLLLRMHTASFVSGRRLVGRTYLVPVVSVVTASAAPNPGTMAAVKAMGDALLDAGITDVHPRVWSRPRPATPVGPKAPAGPARLARSGSSASVQFTSCSSKFVVLTSRRD